MSKPATIKEPCGCAHDNTRWVVLCELHKAEGQQIHEEMTLQSVWWLMQWYDRFPNDDNLRHVIDRMRSLGNKLTGSTHVVQWIAAHRAQLLDWKTRHVANP